MKKRYALIGLLLVVAAVAFFWRSGIVRPVPGKPLPEVSTNPEIASINGYLATFTLIRDALAKFPDMRRALEIPDDPDLPDFCERPVIVSIYRENSPPLWGAGTEGCLKELGLPPSHNCFRDSLLCATYQITQKREYAKFYIVKLDEVAVRVDIVNRLRPLKVTKKDLRSDSVEPGTHGLILQRGDEFVFQPPFNYINYAWDALGPRNRESRLRRQLEFLAESAEVGAGNWSKYPLYRFSSLSVIQHRPDFMPLLLLRDAPLIKRFDSGDIGRAAIDAGRYLNKTFVFQQKRFRYQFNPITMQKGDFLDYDLVDHAAAVYALVKLYKASRKEEFIDISRSAMDYLVSHIEPPLLEPDLLAAERMRQTKLGATSLALLAMTELPEKLLQERIGVDRINRLARFIVEMQEPDGRFYDFYWQRLIGYMPHQPVDYWEGLALMALAKYYKANPNVEWLQAARRAADNQIDRFRRTGEFAPETIQGLAALHEIDDQPLFADACLEMADALQKQQWGNPLYRKPPYADYVGGFTSGRPPRSVSAARGTQALLAAHWLAYRLGRDATPYGNAALMAAHFLLQNQYRRDNTYYVNLPEETRGAIRDGLVDPVISLDTNVHAIIALTGAYDLAYMRETGKVPEEFLAEGTEDLRDNLEIGGKAE